MPLPLVALLRAALYSEFSLVEGGRPTKKEPHAALGAAQARNLRLLFSMEQGRAATLAAVRLLA
eukprot:12353771-Alexandrium_andersonii.AAC.1